MATIEAVGLTRSYGALRAIDDIDLSVDNEIYGLLGPNGSGKTTTVKILTTLLGPTSGSARICGYDVVADGAAVRQCISYVPQDMAVDIRLTGRENVNFFAKLYGIKNRRDRRRGVDDALEIMSLTDRADDLTSTYSGGMRRRLELAQALVHEPEALFLDEPTVGLDVSARRTIWEHISLLRRQGMTVFVTTHQMDEAEKYCDRVGIIRKGVVVQEGTPDRLKGELMRDTITVYTDGRFPKIEMDGVYVIRQEDGQVTLSAEDGSAAIPRIMYQLEGSGIRVRSISVKEPTLEDVFLQSVDVSDDTESFDYRKFRNMMLRR